MDNARGHVGVWLAVGAVVVLGAGVIWFASRNEVITGPWGVAATFPDTPRNDSFEPSRSARRIPIGISAGDCYEDEDVTVDRIDVEETTEDVTITAHLKVPGSPTGDDCLSGTLGVVTLAAPVGDRRLLDGSHDPPVEREFDLR